MGKIQAVIFDVDGTLVDTNRWHVESWRRAFDRYGFSVEPERIAPEIGKGGDKLVPSILGKEAEQAHGDPLREAAGEAFLEIAEAERFDPLPGVVELFEALRARGIRIALATSGEQSKVEALERSAGLALRAHADVVVTGEEVQASKPDPDIVRAALRRLELPPDRCVMVGDTPYDVEAARRAGVACIAVLSGDHGEDALREAGARMVFRDTRALLERLDEALDAATRDDPAGAEGAG